MPTHVPQILLTELERALTATLRFGTRQLQSPRWEPAPSSEAAYELSNTETRQIGDPWGEDIIRTSYAAADLLMTGVRDNLASLRTLLGDPMPTIGPTVVARSAIEIGATAWWLMEPGIGARRRTCRELALSLTSARRAGQIAEEIDDPEGKSKGQAQEARVLRRITELAVAPPMGSRFAPVIEGESCPIATHLTANMFQSCFPAGAPTKSFYRAYSAVTHGEIYGLMNFMIPATHPDGGVFLEWHLPAAVLDTTVQIAIVAFREAYKRIMTVMGWGRIEYELWSAELGKIFNSGSPQVSLEA